MRLKFDEQLELLNQEMIRMGMLCETSIRTSADAVLTGGEREARKLPDMQEQINEKYKEIENFCLRLLLKQQPVAHDLRTISSALKMITDMDRIGTMSSEIAEIVMMHHVKNVQDGIPIADMFEAVIKMVTESIDAFVKNDEKLARSVVEYDDVADECFDKIKSKLIEMLKQPDADGEEALDLLMIAKYLERIGDHAVNIANWVIFSITGEHDELN